jgi:hypothetical protein
VVLLGILGANIVAAVALLPRHAVGFLCFVVATTLVIVANLKHIKSRIHIPP